MRGEIRNTLGDEECKEKESDENGQNAAKRMESSIRADNHIKM